MKLSDRAYIIILILVILVLSVVAYLRFQKSQTSLNVNLPKFELPKMDFDFNQLDWSNSEMPITDRNWGFDWEEGFSPKKGGEEEWVSPDGKLRLTYPDNWIPIEKTLLESGAATGVMLAQEEVLLFIYNFKIAGHSFPSLTVSQISAGKTMEDITEGIRQNLKRNDGELEVVLLESGDNVTNLEIILKYPGEINFYSKGKIIFTERKIYLIFFTVSQSVWPQFEEEAGTILGSVELLE